MEAQPTQVVGDLSRAQLAGLFPQQWSKMLAYILVGKCAMDEKEQQQDVQESLHARIGEAQRRRALVIHGDWSLHILEGGFADEAVVTDAWTSSSRRLAAKPILRSSGRFSMRRPMAKSRVSLMVVSVRSACPSLWYCLMRVFL